MAIKLVEYRENEKNKKEYAIKAISLSSNKIDKEKEIDKAEDVNAKSQLLMHHNKVNYFGLYTNKSMKITMIWPEKKRNVLEGEKVDEECEDGEDTKEKEDGKEKNNGLNGGEVDMDIKDKDDKKFKEDNEKDKRQEKDVADEKLIDNDKYKLELEPREFFNIIMEYLSIGSLKEERTKRVLTGNSFKEEEIYYYYI